MKRAKDTALILASGNTLHGIVLVKSGALERNPELLQRLRQEAEEKYNQVIITAAPVRLRAAELPSWLDRMNGKVEDTLPWIDDTNWAVSEVLDNLSWLPDVRKAVLHLGEGPNGYVVEEAKSLEELIDKLDKVGQKAWESNIPQEAGNAFSYEEHIDARGHLLERWEDELRELGWI